MPFDFLELPYPAMKNFVDQMTNTDLVRVSLQSYRADMAATRKRVVAVEPDSAKMKKIEETHAVIHRKMDETITHQSQILKKLEGFYGSAKDCDEKQENDKEVGEDDEDEEEE